MTRATKIKPLTEEELSRAARGFLTKTVEFYHLLGFVEDFLDFYAGPNRSDDPDDDDWYSHIEDLREAVEKLQ